MEQKTTQATLRGVVIWFGSASILFKTIKLLVPLYFWNIPFLIVDFITYYGLWLIVSCAAIFILYKYLDPETHPVSMGEYFKGKDVRHIAGLLITLFGVAEFAYDLPMSVQTIFMFRSSTYLSQIALLIVDIIQIFCGLYLFLSNKAKSESAKNDSEKSELA